MRMKMCLLLIIVVSLSVSVYGIIGQGLEPVGMIAKPLQGEKGDTGLQGEQGIQGIQGEKGDVGDTGLQGTQGEIGVRGTQGVRGWKGEQGERGEKGEDALPPNTVAVFYYKRLAVHRVTGVVSNNSAFSKSWVKYNISWTPHEDDAYGMYDFEKIEGVPLQIGAMEYIKEEKLEEEK